MRLPYHGTPPISGKLTDLLHAFPHNIHPFLGNFSQLTPYLGNIMVTLIPFLLFYFLFFGLGKYVSYHYLEGGGRGATTDIQLCYNQGPTSFREAIEGSENMYMYV